MYKLALVGATGLVGRTALKVLEEKKMMPICQVTKREKHKSIRRGISFLMDWLWDKTSAGVRRWGSVFIFIFIICTPTFL